MEDLKHIFYFYSVCIYIQTFKLVNEFLNIVKKIKKKVKKNDNTEL